MVKHSKSLSPLQLRIAEFCWGHICDEELTPLDTEIARECRMPAAVIETELAWLCHAGIIDRKTIDGAAHVWRVRLPDGRSANMDLIERGAAR